MYAQHVDKIFPPYRGLKMMTDAFENNRREDKTKTIQERFESEFTKSDGCWEWEASKRGAGYGQFGISGRQQYAHRVAYQLYVGEIPEGLCVLHQCDNRKCVNPDHLFLGTQADNMRDCKNKGRHTRPDNSGEKNNHSKMTETQIIEIRAKYSEGATQSELAKEFGVSQANISDIVCRRTWTKI